MKNRTQGKGDFESSGKFEFLKKHPLIITLIIFVVLLLLLIAVYGIYHVKSSVDESGEVSINVLDGNAAIPDMSPSAIPDATYADISELENNPLEYIVEGDMYSREIRIVQIFNGESSGEKYTVSKAYDSLKAESDSEVILLKNGKLYADYGTYQAEHGADEDTFYQYIGTTSLKMVRDMVRNTEEFESKLSLSEDCTSLTAEILDTEAEVKMVFEINTESGLVVSERFYYKGEPYRYIQTESINYEFKPDGSFFEMP